MGEQGAEAAGLEFPLQPRLEQLLGRVIVDCGGKERLAHGLAAEADQAGERFVLLPGRRGKVARARELRVAQRGGRAQELLDLGAVLPDQPVHRAGGRRRLTQRLHPFPGFALPALRSSRAASLRAR